MKIVNILPLTNSILLAKMKSLLNRRLLILSSHINYTKNLFVIASFLSIGNASILITGYTSKVPSIDLLYHKWWKLLPGLVLVTGIFRLMEKLTNLIYSQASDRHVFIVAKRVLYIVDLALMIARRTIRADSFLVFPRSNQVRGLNIHLFLPTEPQYFTCLA